MRKYKLVKIYPQSPELGTIGCLERGSLNFIHPDGKETFRSSSSNDLKDTFKYDNWEEIIEKDYEILSFNWNGSGNTKANIQKDGTYTSYQMYSSESGSTLNSMLNRKEWNIHSIKRLSDSEVFTVGNKISVKGYDTVILEHMTVFNKNLRLWGKFVCGMKGFVSLNDCIKIVKKPILTTKDNIDVYTGGNLFCVKDFECKPVYNITFVEKDVKYFFKEKAAKDYIKVNKVLFTTEDGIAVFENDNFWYVNSNVWKRYIVEANKYKVDYVISINKYKTFYKEESAIEYILKNKPCLNLEDVRIAMNNSSIPYTYLKELAKKKLKL